MVDSLASSCSFELVSPGLRGSHQRCSIKKVFLKILQNSQENTCARVSFLIILQMPPANFKNTFFTEHHWTTPSVDWEGIHHPSQSSLILTLFRMGLFGSADGRGEQKAPPLKYVTHILQWWNLAQLYFT